MTVASTPSDAHSADSSSHFSGGTARTIRSWASEIQISVYDKPFVLQRRAVQPDLGADLLAHLAHGAGEAAGAAVGHGVVQAAVAGGQQHVQHHLLGDRVADLHRAAGDASRSGWSVRPS